MMMLVENLPKEVLPAPNVNFEVNASLRWNRQKIPSFEARWNFRGAKGSFPRNIIRKTK
jgi:hypothetical protein